MHRVILILRTKASKNIIIILIIEKTLIGLHIGHIWHVVILRGILFIRHQHVIVVLVIDIVVWLRYRPFLVFGVDGHVYGVLDVGIGEFGFSGCLVLIKIDRMLVVLSAKIRILTLESLIIIKIKLLIDHKVSARISKHLIIQSIIILIIRLRATFDGLFRNRFIRPSLAVAGGFAIVWRRLVVWGIHFRDIVYWLYSKVT